MELPKREDIQAVLERAAARGGEFVELFFETDTSNVLSCEESRIERINSGIDVGVGLRILSKGRTAYGYSNTVGSDELERLADEVARGVGGGVGRVSRPGSTLRGGTPDVGRPAELVQISEKADIVLAADAAARRAGAEISQVQITYTDSIQRVAVFNSEGDAVEDERRQVVFFVRAIASNGGCLQTAYRNFGGRHGFEIFGTGEPERLAAEAGEAAVRMLRARRAPAGRMTVVLGSKAGGTMTHEAIGHGLEGDAAEKALSIYSGKEGEMVASPLVTVIDDATLPGRRGSYEYDDEGVAARRNVLVERGVLRGYLLDRRSAMKMGLKSTGNGRRQSFRHRPIVRMSNTMIGPGEHDPEEIISTVREGLYVERMGGGQVDTSSGDFVFKVNEAYLIRDGKAAEPVRGATLIGNGPAILREIDMVGNDLGFDIGTCGKDGQHVPVADAQPTLRIPAITVGGEV